MSMCDICSKPGNCCQKFPIYHLDSSRFEFATLTHANIFMAVHNHPMIAEEYDKEQNVLFSCPMLTEKGLCSIYEHRPSMCRDFEPITGGPICVYFGKIINNKDMPEYNGEGLA